MKVHFGNHRKHFIVLWVFLIAYAILPNRYAMHDAIRYAITIESGTVQSTALWHPSHLLYGPIGYLLFHGTQRLGIEITPFQVYTTLGVLSFFLLAYILGRLLVLSGILPRFAALSLAMWMSSYVAWHSATSSDLARNVIPLLFIVCSFYIIAWGAQQYIKAWPYLAGLFIGLAGLSHILSVLAVPALFLFIWESTRTKCRFKVFISVLVVAVLTLISGYILAFINIEDVQNIKGFFTWFMKPGGHEWWQLNLLRGTVDLVLTMMRSVFGTVTYGPLKSAILSIGIEHTGIIILSFVSLIILIYWSIKVLFLLKLPCILPSPLTRAMLLWLCFHTGFAIIFDRGNIRMVLYLSIPFIVLVAESLKQRIANQFPLAALCTIVLLVSINTSTIFIKESKPKTQKAYRELVAMNEVSKDLDDLFLVVMGTDAIYAQYFGNRKAISLGTGTLNEKNLIDNVTRTRELGKKVYISNELLRGISNGDYVNNLRLTTVIALIGEGSITTDDRKYTLIIKPYQNNINNK